MKPIGKLIIQNSQTRDNGTSNLPDFPIRVKDKNSKLYIDNEYIELGYISHFSKNTTPVYLVLAKYANYETQTCFPSVKTIMEKAGISNRNEVFKAIKTLEKYRIIYIKHSTGKYPNVYKLLSHTVWIPINPNGSNNDTVSKLTTKPYLKPTVNSTKIDTRNNINKEYNEMDKNFSEERKSFNVGYPALDGFYEASDIESAAEFLKDSNNPSNTIGVKKLLEQWTREGKIKPLKIMPW